MNLTNHAEWCEVYDVNASVWLLLLDRHKEVIGWEECIHLPCQRKVLVIPCLLSWGSIALLEPLLRGNDLPNISVDMSRWARQKSYFKNIDSSIVPFSVVVKGELICVYFCSCLLGEGGEGLRKKHENSRAMIVELVLGRSVIKSSPL